MPLDEEFDLYTTRSGRVIVRAPRAVIAVEGFERRGEQFVVRKRSLLDAVIDLEGRWIRPSTGDPFRADAEKTICPTAKELAAMPRQSTAVLTARDIQDALLERVRPAATYRLRWIE